MNSSLAVLAILALSIGLIGNAYAHKEQVMGDYKIDIIWAKEPRVGKPNSIEVIVTTASASDKMMMEMKGMTDGQMANMDHSKMLDPSTKPDAKKPMAKSSTVKKSIVPPAHETKSTGITGLKLDADITINGKNITLKLIENKKTKGKYSAAFTPMGEGSPIVHVVGKIKNTPIEVSFHPEKVEKSTK